MLQKSTLQEYEKKFLWKLMAISGVCWTFAQLLMIKIGFQDSITAMPFLALCAGFAWKVIFIFIYPQKKTQLIINSVWMVLDFILIYQFLIFNNTAGLTSLFPGLSTLMLNTISFLVVLSLCFFIILKMAKEFSDTDKGAYSAFGINLLMSCLFIGMVLSRQSVAGQSIYILGLMMLGTLIPSYCFYRGYPHSSLLNSIYIATFFVDILYGFLLLKTHLLIGVHPLLRF